MTTALTYLGVALVVVYAVALVVAVVAYIVVPLPSRDRS
jgi:hypothetical protein